ncbi:PAS domain-containing protein [Alicyclobacillus dauci]|uniref:histidine kinase n=1 Tax=Alicyclobacillus dauci TaxID=1475485 RepID=A0ABY6Z979_9BACL|nr:PAS domain S-box protein [Alicyclobacillus dauci]WAH38645.1 PAS domain S-box protein [Alicyclobacillus dauci]
MKKPINVKGSLLRKHLSSYDAYRSVFDNHPDIVCVVDDQGYFQDCNSATYKLLGYARMEFLGKRIGDFAVESERKSVVGAFKQALLGEPQQLEVLCHSKSGDKLYLALTLVPALIEGQVVGVYEFGKNISERIEIQHELIRNEVRMRHAQDIANFGIWEYDLITKQAESSEHLQKMFGFDHPTNNPEDFYDRVHRDDIDHVTRINKDTDLPDDSLTEMRIVRPDGEIRTLLSHWKRFSSKNGIPSKVYGVFQDVTERKKVEEELRQSRERLAEAQSIAHLGDWSWNVTSNELKFSVESGSILGLDHVPVAMSLDMWLSLVHPDDREATRAALQQLHEDGYLRFHECRLIRPDKTERYVSIHGYSKCDEHGRVIEVIGTVQDVTAKKRTDEIIRNSDKLLIIGELAAGIAHEIRNPLTTLKGFLQLLVAKETDTKQRLEYYRVMEDALNHIEFVAGEMLVLAKPQVTHVVEHDVMTILREVVNLLSAEALLKSVEINIQTLDEPAVILCDKNQIKQVFINIIKNAIEAMSTGGLLKIMSQQMNDHVEIHIQDNGLGIESDRIPKLFEPFYTTKEKGTGLGLMISQKILRDHNSTISIVSEPGQGTTAIVSIPLQRGTSSTCPA